MYVLSFFFVILSHTQSRPSVKRWVANSPNMRCPCNLASFQDVFRQLFSHNFRCEKVVNLVLIFRCQDWAARFTVYTCQFPSIRHHSRELPACDCVVLCSFVTVVTAVLCSKFMHAVTWTALVACYEETVCYQVPFHSVLSILLLCPVPEICTQNLTKI